MLSQRGGSFSGLQPWCLEPAGWKRPCRWPESASDRRRLIESDRKVPELAPGLTAAVKPRCLYCPCKPRSGSDSQDYWRAALPVARVWLTMRQTELLCVRSSKSSPAERDGSLSLFLSTCRTSRGFLSESLQPRAVLPHAYQLRHVLSLPASHL